MSRKADELFVEHTYKKETKRKEGPSWKTDVAKADKSPKVLRGNPKTKAVAASLEVITEI